MSNREEKIKLFKRIIKGKQRQAQLHDLR